MAVSGAARTAADVPSTTHRLPEDPQQALAELIAIIGELVRQTHPGAPRTITADSRLDTDLGLDSLARIELLHRVEDAFQMRIAEQTLLEIETPRELLSALRAAVGAPEPSSPPSAQTEAARATLAIGTPESAVTLVDMLDWYAQGAPNRTHVLFYRGAQELEALDYARLAQAAREVAAGLIAHGLERQQTVAIMLPTSLEFFYTFYGILLAGGIPVPIYPPARLSQIEDHLRRQAAILDSAQSVLLVTVNEARLLAQFLRGEVGSLRDIVTVAQLRSARIEVTLPAIEPDDVAFIQYTSGSTGNPKGVTLTHANLLANIRAWGRGVKLTAEDVCVSWLPLYHDMGLIGAWMGSLYHGGLLVLMSPLDFLARPERWLQAIDHHRGTVTAAPNFAFELCLRRIPDAVLEGLDLSCWRLAANGAEPVSPDTLTRFAERFERCGFRREALAPVYGLAECTVGLAIPPLGRGPVIDRIERATLVESGRAVPAAADDPTALRYVACGRPLPGHEIRVVDDAGQEVGERIVGRLQFRGPSATSGYYRNPEETRRLFDGTWLNSGDVAYIADGDVYLTSRVKDMIIRGGRNLYPYELEEAIGNLAGIRKGCVAVVGVMDHASGTERLVVIAELRRGNDADLDALRARINSLGIDLIGAPPDEIVLAPPNTVLKTSSGKIRRAATRDVYLSGAIGRRGAGFRWQIARLALKSARATLRRGVRRIASWLYAARAWSAFVLLSPVAWTAAVAAGQPQRAWRISGRIARVFFALAGIPVEVSGNSRLPQGTPYVLVANHASYLDGILLVGALSEQHAFIAKREFLGHAIPRLYLSAIGSEYVERFDAARGVEDVRRFTEHARQGERLAIFPEGTFTRQTGLRPFLMGAFVIAADAGIPVVPVTITGAREILRDGTWLPSRGRVAIRIATPIYPHGTGWEAAVRLRDEARALMLTQGGEPALDGTAVVDKRRRPG
ncbi:MAG: acyl-phosphate glycerol 3-phosphate acyltransferase [Betaproteobacteria bacterium]|nr:MAG: acyl-phosphate glycerol 3-phosphate acyltransferase [Betaproteobacteria bacterium]